MSETLELNGVGEEAGFGEVGDAVRVHTRSYFEVVPLLADRNRLVIRPA
jgi:hypothetical protein